MDALSDPAKTLTAVGTLSAAVAALAAYYARSVSAWSQERTQLLETARQERDKILAEARAERERLEKQIADERMQTAAVYEKRVADQKEAAEKLYEQNSGWMDLVNDVNRVLVTLNDRVANLNGGRR